MAVPKDYVRIDKSSLQPGHGPVYSVGSLPGYEFPSMLHVLQNSVKNGRNNAFLGHRQLNEAGDAGDYVWETYAQCYKRIQNLAGGLMHEKLIDVTADGERPLCIYMRNRPEWVLAQYAAMYCGGFPVALYDTLGESAIEFIVNQTLVTTVVCTSSELLKVLTARGSAPSLRYVILADVADVAKLQLATEANAAGLLVYTFPQLEKIGAAHAVKQAEPTYCLIYTSGTTAVPKGVPISQRNVLAQYQAIYERLAVGAGQAMFTSAAVHFSYFTLAHCSEHMTHSYVIYQRGSIGFYQGSAQKVVDDLVALRPTFFTSVPRLLNKFYDKITSAAKAAGGLKTWLFDYALDVKLKNLKKGYNTHFLYDALVFSSIKAKLGLDRCCCVITGAAPIAPHVLDFLRVLFGRAVHEAYGQSEAMGESLELSLQTWAWATSAPEKGYEVTDTEHQDGEGICLPVNGRGEVCLHGANVFTGYYKAPDKTAEAVDDDGWLHTGNIGVWTKDHRLKIADRKKNIFKLSQGEYVAPEKIENVLVNCPYVAEPFVYGDSRHAVLVAIVVPEEEHLVALAKSMEIPGSFADLCSNKHVTDAVLTDLTVLCKKNKLCGFEIPKAIKLEPTPFTVENNLMTPTFKLKRVDVKAAFLQDIDRLYVQCGDLVAGR
ncbi:unnamed protein product [Aphanomyces euteiches]